LGEGTMTVQALKYIAEKKLEYDFLYKISGRYYLTENFNTSLPGLLGSAVYMYSNQGITTTFFKLSREHCEKLGEFLVSKRSLMFNYGYEDLFKMFIDTLKGVTFIDKIGIEGLISVNSAFFSV